MDFIVHRKDFSQCKFTDSENEEGTGAESGQVILRVSKFAFTANNITYAVAGEMLSYWNFFPAEEGWGRIPVWGIGVVAQSTLEELKEGERFYGYFPMSKYLTVQPAKITPHGFMDASPHRQALPPTYNQYSRMTPELGFEEKYDDHAMVFRPLYMTSFLLDDFLEDNGFFDAQTVVISSASSKTAFGLAFLLSGRKPSPCKVIGLTSSGNVDFVKGLGCYDSVVTYDDIKSLPEGKPTVFVDMAGNAEVLSAIHHHLGDEMKYSCLVGITHWKKNAPAPELPGATPTFFFAPDQIQKRTKDWGGGEFQERFAKAWDAFMAPVGDWIRIVHGHGEAAVEEVYRDTLEGRAKPDRGYILSL